VVNGDDYEYQLIKDLLRGYDPRIRPSVNSSEPLNVTFGVALAQIIDVVSSTVILLLLLLQSVYYYKLLSDDLHPCISCCRHLDTS